MEMFHLGEKKKQPNARCRSYHRRYLWHTFEAANKTGPERGIPLKVLRQLRIVTLGSRGVFPSSGRIRTACRSTSALRCSAIRKADGAPTGSQLHLSTARQALAKEAAVRIQHICDQLQLNDCDQYPHRGPGNSYNVDDRLSQGWAKPLDLVG